MSWSNRALDRALSVFDGELSIGLTLSGRALRNMEQQRLVLAKPRNGDDGRERRNAEDIEFPRFLTTGSYDGWAIYDETGVLATGELAKRDMERGDRVVIDVGAVVVRVRT